MTKESPGSKLAENYADKERQINFYENGPFSGKRKDYVTESDLRNATEDLLYKIENSGLSEDGQRTLRWKVDDFIAIERRKLDGELNVMEAAAGEKLGQFAKQAVAAIDGFMQRDDVVALIEQESRNIKIQGSLTSELSGIFKGLNKDFAYSVTSSEGGKVTISRGRKVLYKIWVTNRGKIKVDGTTYNGDEGIGKARDFIIAGFLALSGHKLIGNDQLAVKHSGEMESHRFVVDAGDFGLHFASEIEKEGATLIPIKNSDNEYLAEVRITDKTTDVVGKNPYYDVSVNGDRIVVARNKRKPGGNSDVAGYQH